MMQNATKEQTWERELYPEYFQSSHGRRKRSFAVLSALDYTNSIIHINGYDADDVLVRQLRSTEDIIRFRNYCHWAGGWLTQMLGLALPCVIHDTVHLMLGHDPMQDTPVNSPDINVLLP